MTDYKLLHGDCRDQLKTLPDNSIDSIVTDPPYELGFMGKSWDATGIAYNVDMWRECLRVLKPGGHMLAFSGSRTYHRMTVAIEDAGFEIRDQIMWVYGSGFPKSHDISKAIDAKLLTGGSDSKGLKKANELRPGESRATGILPNNGMMSETRVGGFYTNDNPATDDANKWVGWGTALKPAHEPICVARKPLEGTVAQNVLKHGTGGLNIDASRVGGDLPKPMTGQGWAAQDKKNAEEGFRPKAYYEDQSGVDYEPNELGRWPANFIHDGSSEVAELFPQSKGQQGEVKGTEPSHTGDENANTYGEYKRVAFAKRKEGGKGGIWSSGNGIPVGPTYIDAGSAARFFYCAKASKADRNAGCSELPDKEWKNDGAAIPERANRPFNPSKNNHPTVKPTELMRYLVKMVTPTGGTVLDPFTGSGSTGRGAMLCGFNFIGIEMTDEYIPIATARIEDAKQEFENNNNIVYNNLFEEE